MPYAATLIDRAMQATGATSQTAFAKLIDVAQPTVSQWRHGTSPMPEERVLQLCALAGIEDTGPWLVAAQADAARSDAVRTALESVLDRLRPALAGVGLLVLALAGFWTPFPALAAQAEPLHERCIMRTAAAAERLHEVCIMRTLRALSRRVFGWLAAWRIHAPSPVLA